MTNYASDYLSRYNRRTSEVNAQVLGEIETLHSKAVHEMSQDDIIGYSKYISEQSTNTIRRKLSTLSGYYNYLIRRDVLSKNPVVAVRVPRSEPLRTIKWLDESQVEALVDNTNNVMTKAILHCGLSGLRLAEIVSLNIEQYSDGRLWNVIGKGGRVRTIPLTLQAAQAVENHIQQRTRGPLFSLRWENRISPRSVQKMVAQAASEALGRHVNVHQLRHSYATLLAKADVPITKMSLLLGHANPTTTMIYTHLDDQDLVDEVRKLDKPIRAQLALVREEAG